MPRSDRVSRTIRVKIIAQIQMCRTLFTVDFQINSFKLHTCKYLFTIHFQNKYTRVCINLISLCINLNLYLCILYSFPLCNKQPDGEVSELAFKTAYLQILLRYNVLTY